ncbi:hypothetical protein [Coraliomargarita parva]|uniref:phosphotriesterase family protein n=1 Tax=Coraliomargarita parva TaxID=3014050 RepID=UPI0022B4CBFA|nr:hypothetical protein [Coraliomargarita parva]
MSQIEYKVETVLGPVAAEDLGPTLIHEHILCSSLSLYHYFGERWFRREDVIQTATNKLRRLAQRHGVRTVVDGTPLNLTRDLRLLAEVSRRSGVHLVASTGFYYYDDFSYSRFPAEDLASYLVDECKYGAEDSSIRPGILKCAVEEMTSAARYLLEAVGRAQSATGLPLFVHTAPTRRNTHEVLDLLQSAGATLGKIIVGHCGDTDNISYVREILARGCWVEIDRLRRNQPEVLARKAAMVASLAEDWLHRLLISHDYICYDNLQDEKTRHRSEPFEDADYDGLCLIHDEVLPMLRCDGIEEEQVQQLLCINPRTVLTSNKATHC